MELFIRYWSPGPGENPEKVQGLGPGLGENFHRVEGDRWDPGIRPHWLGRVSRSVEKPEKSKVLRSLSRSHFFTSARSLLEHSQAARGHSWGELGVTTGADQAAARGYSRGHCPGHRVPGTGRGLAKFRRLHRSSPPGRDLPRETPRVRADLYRPVQTCAKLRLLRPRLRFFWQSPAVLLENPGPGQSIRSLLLNPRKKMLSETLVAEFFRILEKTGRDWHRVRWAIRGLESEIRRSAHGQPWSDELEGYLVFRIGEALTTAQSVAVEREEFEWAHEIGVRLRELGHDPENTLTNTDAKTT